MKKEAGGRRRRREMIKRQKGEREVASPRQLKAMRGTAVGSFLSGSVNPHAPHTHIFIQSLSAKGLSSPGWGGDGGRHLADTLRLTQQSACPLVFLLCPSSSTTTLHCTPARLPQGCPTVKWLPDLFVCSRGWGRCMWRMHRVCGQWRHWESREGRVVVFWHRIPRPFHFFPPSFLWFYGLLTGSRLSSGYKRGSLADLLQRFLQWLQEKRDLQQGWTG